MNCHVEALANLMAQLKLTTHMNFQSLFSRNLCVVVASMLAAGAVAQAASTDAPYKIVATNQLAGTGRTDYVYADNDGGRIYVPRGNQINVFDLTTLQSVGVVSNSGGSGVAVDPKSHHGFSSSSPVTMFDSKLLEVLKKITVSGRPDGILFEPLTEKIYVLSHSQPNVTVIDGKDGSVTGTIDLGGAPEQGASDGAGHVYIDVEDGDNIAVVDANAMKVTTHYSLGGKGGGPGGLGLDIKNHILFAMCHTPATCVILSATDGKILDTIPIHQGTDGGGFNPNTMEAFSSQADGTLSIIKENSPTSFTAEPVVQTKSGARTCTLDTKNNRIVVITVEAAPAGAGGAAGAPTGGAPGMAAGGAPAGPGGGPGGFAGGNRRGGGRGGANGLLDVIAVGR